MATLVAIVLGLRSSALNEVIGNVLAMCAEAGTQPLFVTDLLDLRVFHRRRVVVETLPFCRGRSYGDNARWKLYRDEECRRIGRIWRPRAVVEFGRPLEPGQKALLMRP